MNGPTLAAAVPLVLIGLLLAPSLDSSPPEPPAPWERTLRKQVTVPAPVEDVWKAWTTTEGVTTFFGPQAKVEAVPGGPFEIYFDPNQPVGLRGSEGCKVQSIVPLKLFAFEWNAPPIIPAIRNSGLHTIVYVRLDQEGPGQTRVEVVHAGWGVGEEWDKTFSYFDQAWDAVLSNLRYRFAVGPVQWPGRFVRAELPPEAAKPSHTRGQIATLDDFRWLVGQWTGTLESVRLAETNWAAPKAGVMMGMFRLTEADKLLVLEFFTLRETEEGLEMRVRHFNAALEPWETGDALILKLTSYDGQQAIFENPVHTRPKRTVIIRTGDDTWTAHSEIIRDNGEERIIEVPYQRVSAENPTAGIPKTGQEEHADGRFKNLVPPSSSQ